MIIIFAFLTFFTLVTSSHARQNNDFVQVILPDPHLELSLKQTIHSQMISDGILYVNREKKSCGRVSCKGIGSHCVELVYDGVLKSWCYCGSKNYGPTCNNRFERYNGSSQKMKNQLNLRNISRDAKKTFKKLKDYYLRRLRRRKAKGAVDSRKWWWGDVKACPVLRFEHYSWNTLLGVWPPEIFVTVRFRTNGCMNIWFSK